MKAAAVVAAQNSRKPKSVQRQRPLKVSGVGNGSQQCKFDCCLPVALKRTDGSTVEGTFTAPTVGDSSELPSLLGLQTLIDNKAILDFGTRQLHFIKNGAATIDLPSGSSTFQLEHAPSGHLVLPCSNFQEAEEQRKKLDDEEMALMETETSPSSSSSSTAPIGGKFQ